MKSTVTLKENACEPGINTARAAQALFFGSCPDLLFFWMSLHHGLLYVQQQNFKKSHHRFKKPCGGLASQCIRMDTAAGS